MLAWQERRHRHKLLPLCSHRSHWGVGQRALRVVLEEEEEEEEEEEAHPRIRPQRGELRQRQSQVRRKRQSMRK